MAKRGPSSSPNHTRGDVAESPMTSSDLAGLEELTSLALPVGIGDGIKVKERSLCDETAG